MFSISLTVDSYYEYFLTMLGWIISNHIWELLLYTGIFAAPFVFHTIALFFKAREQGDDEGNTGKLLAKWLEHRTYSALLIVVFTCMPVFTVSYSALQFDTERMKECKVAVYKPGETKLSGLASELGDKSAALPIWWAFTHSVGKGLTHGAIAALPCKPDLRQIRFEIQHTQITNPVLRQEIEEFVADCFIPSRAKVKRQRIEVDEVQARDIDWIGSNLFVDTPGFYNVYRSQMPRPHWNYDPVRDVALLNTGLGGYPSCKEWWTDEKVGLKTRLIQQVKPSTWTQLSQIWSDKSVYEETVLRRLVSPQNLAVSSGRAIYGGYGTSTREIALSGEMGLTDLFTFADDALTYAAGGAASTAGWVISAPVFDVIKQALPMIQGLLLMSIAIGIPLVTVFSGYSAKAFVTLTFVQFSLFFLSFWWELAKWLDNWLIETLYSSDTHSRWNLMGLMNFTDDNIMKMVINSLYLLLPGLWIAMVGWTGVQAGTEFNNAVNSGVADTKDRTQNRVNRVV